MPPTLAIEDLRFRYGSTGPWTVDVQHLEIHPAEQVLLTAPSGLGKSTLLNLIAGLLEPGEGRVAVDGQRIHELAGHRRDRFRGDRIGMIFQTFNLLVGFTARQNVLAALHFSSVPRREHDERAASLLERLGIERADALVEELSVGQQQRVAVARAMACTPKLVLADEPTASLDPPTAEVAIDLIRSLCAELGAALVCTSHDPAMATRFERRIDLAELRSERKG